MADITIPPAALEAGKDTAFAWLRSHMEDDVRVQNMTDEELGELVEAACLAMLAAWPGVKLENLCGWVMDGPDLPYVEEVASIILPLTETSTKENDNG